MKLEDLSRREFSKIAGSLALVGLFSPMSFAKNTEDTLSTKDVQKLMGYEETCKEGFRFNKDDFKFNLIGDTKSIKNYLAKEKEIERKIRIGERDFKKKETKSIQKWMEQGIFPDIKYELSYSHGWANAAASIPWVNSEIKIDVINSEGREDLFIIDTVDPDYKFKLKTEKGRTKLKEELNGNDSEYQLTNTGYYNNLGEQLTERQDIDVHSRVQKLYHNFRDFLSTEHKTNLPLFVGGEVVDIDVNMKRISDEWFSIYSIFDHNKEKLIKENSYDKGRVKRVDVLLYMPKDSTIGIPYNVNMMTLKYEKDDKSKEFKHEHVEIIGKLKI